MNDTGLDTSNEFVAEWERGIAGSLAARRPIFVEQSAVAFTKRISQMSAVAAIKVAGRDIYVTAEDGTAVTYSVPEICDNPTDALLDSVIKAPDAENLLLGAAKYKSA